MMNKTEDYEVGEVLVCRKYLKISSGTTYSVNFEYTIEAVKAGSLVIKELHSTIALELKLEVIKNISFTATAGPATASRAHQLTTR